MTEPDDRTPMPVPSEPADDLDFEVETEAMPDGRRIHYYRWPEPDTPADEFPGNVRV
jgi:hypothetical protein